MNDSTDLEGGELPSGPGSKPSIAEVAAWLRRAAEQHDPDKGRSPVPPTPGSAETDLDRSPPLSIGGPEGDSPLAPDRTPSTEAEPAPEEPTVETKPSESPAIDSPPVDGPLFGTPLAEAPPAETPLAEPLLAQTPPADTPPADTPPADSTAVDTAVLDTTVVEGPAGYDGPSDAPFNPDAAGGDTATAIQDRGDATTHAAPHEEAPPGDITLVDTPKIQDPPADATPFDSTDDHNSGGDGGPNVESSAVGTDGPDDPQGRRQAAEAYGFGASADTADREEETRTGFDEAADQAVPATPVPFSAPTIPDDMPLDGEALVGAEPALTGYVDESPAEAAPPAVADGLEPDDEAGREGPGVDPGITDTSADAPLGQVLVDDDIGQATEEKQSSGSERGGEPDTTPDTTPGTQPESTAPEPARPGPSDISHKVSLFDLDLAELAARARASAGGSEPAASSGEPGRGLRVLPGTAKPPFEFEPQPVGTQPDTGEVVEKPAKNKVAAPHRRREQRETKHRHFPRGQLKERIGILRRIRAMLGVVVLTVILGVAAGGAIGTILLFVSFAIRSAITSK